MIAGFACAFALANPAYAREAFLKLSKLSEETSAVEPAAPAARDLLEDDWRPRFSDGLRPKLKDLDCAGKGRKCDQQHGVYEDQIFLRFDDCSTRPGCLYRLTGPGNDVAILVKYTGPVTSGNEKYLVRISRGTLPEAPPIITVEGPKCGKKKDDQPCIELSGFPEGSAFKNGPYVLDTRKIEPKQGQILGDVFTPEALSFGANLACYDITKLKEDYQQTGCEQDIFANPNTEFRETRRYDMVAAPDHKIAIPFGWQYAPRDDGWGKKRARILESGEDVMEASNRSVGWNAGLDLGVFKFAVYQNKTTSERVEEMYRDNLSYSRYEYLQTKEAIVLDKWNVVLSKGFNDLVRELADCEGCNQKMQQLIENFGTHYAYAVTVGERGHAISTMTEMQISKMHEDSLTETSGGSVGFMIPVKDVGKFKFSAGVDDSTAQTYQKKTSNILGADFGEVVCYGGTSCNGERASGGAVVPVLLDLRPISDLLAPPFFLDVDNLYDVREKLQAYLRDYIYTNTPAPAEPAASFLLVSEPRILECRSENRSEQRYCSIEDVRIFRWAGPEGAFNPLTKKYLIPLTTEQNRSTTVWLTATYKNSWLAAAKKQREKEIAAYEDLMEVYDGPIPQPYGPAELVIETPVAPADDLFWKRTYVLGPTTVTIGMTVRRVSADDLFEGGD